MVAVGVSANDGPVAIVPAMATEQMGVISGVQFGCVPVPGATSRNVRLTCGVDGANTVPVDEHPIPRLFAKYSFGPVDGLVSQDCVARGARFGFVCVAPIVTIVVMHKLQFFHC